MRQVKNHNKPAQVVELDNRDRAIIALAKIKEERSKMKFVRIPCEKGFREIELEKFIKQQKIK